MDLVTAPHLSVLGPVPGEPRPVAHTQPLLLPLLQPLLGPQHRGGDVPPLLHTVIQLST